MANLLWLVVSICSSTDEVTNVLEVWDEGSQTWTHPFPTMPSARYSPSVISYKIGWLLVVEMKEAPFYKRLSSSAFFQSNGMKAHHYPMNVLKCLQPSVETCGTCHKEVLLKQKSSMYSVCAWMSSSLKLFHSLLMQLYHPHHHHG